MECLFTVMRNKNEQEVMSCVALQNILSTLLHAFTKLNSADLMTCPLESLEDLIETMQTGLAHAIDGGVPLSLAEVWGPVASCGV